jgi:xylulokinase
LSSSSFFLGIDLGTQAIKALLVDLDGQIAGRAQVERSPTSPHPGWVEMDAERDLWEGTRQALKQLFASTDVSSKTIEVIGISGLVPCLCPIDREGRPVGSMILYSDNRALNELAWVNQTADLHLTAEAAIPKLVWIHNHEPQRYARINTVLSAHNYVVFRMTGESCIDYDTAAILGGIFDPTEKSWITDICHKLELSPELFPALKPATAIVGKVTHQAALQTGLPEGVPVIAGSGDTFPTLLGCGVIDPGDAMISFGTTGLLTLTRKPLVESANGPHFDNGYGNASVSWVANVLSAGRLVNWFCTQFGNSLYINQAQADSSIFSWLEEQAGKLLPGADGLIVLPHWLGRRTPDPDPLLRGAMIGFTPSHTPVHIYRAILESFAYNVCQTYDAVKPGVHRLVATAGGACSKLWRQIVTDVLNTPIAYYPKSSGALGIAFLAGYASGLIPNFAEIKNQWLYDPVMTYPGPEVKIYKKYFEIYCEFERQMAAPFAHLSKVG